MCDLAKKISPKRSLAKFSSLIESFRAFNGKLFNTLFKLFFKTVFENVFKNVFKTVLKIIK